MTSQRVFGHGTSQSALRSTRFDHVSVCVGKWLWVKAGIPWSTYTEGQATCCWGLKVLTHPRIGTLWQIRSEETVAQASQPMTFTLQSLANARFNKSTILKRFVGDVETQ